MAGQRASTLLAFLSVALLLGWFWQRGERFIAANGPTFDEGVHLTAGYSYWTTGDFRLNAEDPPLLKLFWALPLVLGDAPSYPVELAATSNNHWHVADAWLYGSGVSLRSLLDPARRVNLAVGCCVLLLTGWWSYRVWGTKLAGVLGCAFAASDPTLLAPSCVLSTDVGLTLFTATTCYLLWEYVGAPSRGLLVAAGLSLGLMLATKFSAVAVVVALGVTGAIHVVRGGSLSLPGKGEAIGFRPALELALRLATIAVVTVAVIYGFINFDQWGKGLKFQLTRADHGDGIAYLNGELSRSGWFHYFLVALALKLPLGLLLAASMSTVFLLGSRSGQRRAVEGTPRPTTPTRWVWLVGPPVVFFALASYSRVNVGIRVVLPVLPFLYLLSAGLVVGCCRRLVRFLLLVGCLTWCVVAANCANPSEIAYFNELSPDAVKPLADSNLDWGQGLPGLKTWMDASGVDVVYLAYFGTDRPEAHGIRYQALPGYGHFGPPAGETIPPDAPRHVVAVSANHLVGLFLNDPQAYAWLRTRTPTTIIGGSIHVFDLTGDGEAVRRVRSISPR